MTWLTYLQKLQNLNQTIFHPKWYPGLQSNHVRLMFKHGIYIIIPYFTLFLMMSYLMDKPCAFCPGWCLLWDVILT